MFGKCLFFPLLPLLRAIFGERTMGVIGLAVDLDRVTTKPPVKAFDLTLASSCARAFIDASFKLRKLRAELRKIGFVVSRKFLRLRGKIDFHSPRRVCMLGFRGMELSDNGPDDCSPVLVRSLLFSLLLTYSRKHFRNFWLETPSFSNINGSGKPRRLAVSRSFSYSFWSGKTPT